MYRLPRSAFLQTMLDVIIVIVIMALAKHLSVLRQYISGRYSQSFNAIIGTQMLETVVTVL